MQPDSPRGLYGQRPSKSADAARRAEFEALARPGFPRATDDFDLATDVDPFRELKPIVEAPVGREAVHQAIPIEGTAFRVVDLHHLIALKLYAKSRKSEIDILELPERNRSLDVSALRTVCDRFGLRERLEPLLAEVGLS